MRSAWERQCAGPLCLPTRALSSASGGSRWGRCGSRRTGSTTASVVRCRCVSVNAAITATFTAPASARRSAAASRYGELRRGIRGAAGGARRHAARQRRWRERQREKLKIVTHQGSPLTVTQCIVSAQCRHPEPTDRCESLRARATAQNRSIARSLRVLWGGAPRIGPVSGPGAGADEGHARRVAAPIMISRALEAEILRLYHAEGWPIGTIARQLHMHHGTVRRVLWQSGVTAVRECARTSKLDAYVPFIQETFARYPTLRASRLYQMVRERGYVGQPRSLPAHGRPIATAAGGRGVSALAHLAGGTRPDRLGALRQAHHRPRAAAADGLRDGALLLAASVRALLLERRAPRSFLDAHVQAFAYFTAVPRICLYDNLRSAVLERSGDAIRFNPTLLELAAWYRFQPRPVAVARGNEKGRVERAIRFVRERFFAARRFADVADLNAQALAWCSGEAAARPCPEDRTRSVRECFEEERPRLLTLPDNPSRARSASWCGCIKHPTPASTGMTTRSRTPTCAARSRSVPPPIPCVSSMPVPSSPSIRAATIATSRSRIHRISRTWPTRSAALGVTGPWIGCTTRPRAGEVLRRRGAARRASGRAHARPDRSARYPRRRGSGGGVDRRARRGLRAPGRRAPLRRSASRPARRTPADPGASAR